MSEEQKQEVSTFPGFNVLIMGPAGTGKTYSLGTLVETGLEVFYLGLEPGLESLIGYFTDPPPRGKGLSRPPPNLHWHYLKQTSQTVAEMGEMAKKIGMFDQKVLAGMKDQNRAKNNPMVGVYEQLNAFYDQGSKKTYEAIDNWGTDRVLVIDSLTALALLMMKMAVGDAPLRDKPHYGLAQGNLMSFIHKLTTACNCHFVLLAHVDREVDEVMGGIKLMPHLGIGKAILADLPQPFSDVILSVREASNFHWDTANSQADLKTRSLPILSKNPADFRQIYKVWLSRKEAAERLGI